MANGLFLPGNPQADNVASKNTLPSNNHSFDAESDEDVVSDNDTCVTETEDDDVVSDNDTSDAESDCDVVWKKLLPSDYKEIISRSVSPIAFDSKKELYTYLCDHHVLIDGGNKSFALEKRNGKKCYMIGARELSIEWGNDPRYWRWRYETGSRFAEVAELLGVCWLDIHGMIKTQILSPKTTYAAYLVVKFVEEGVGSYGFDSHPAEFLVNFVRGRGGANGGGGGGGSGGSQNKYYLNDHSITRQHESGNGWMEIEMGEFFNDTGENRNVQMRLLETDGDWKCGLIIQGIEIRPKERNGKSYLLKNKSTTTQNGRPTSSDRIIEIVEGDTLWDLARKYGVEITALKEANGLTGNTIYAGKRLLIP